MGGGEASVKGGEKRAAGGAKENLRSGQGINKYSNINETAKKLETELQEKSGRSLRRFSAETGASQPPFTADLPPISPKKLEQSPPGRAYPPASALPEDPGTSGPEPEASG